MANATAMVGQIINEDPAWTLQLWDTPPTASNYAKFDVELWKVLHSIIPTTYRYSRYTYKDKWIRLGMSIQETYLSYLNEYVPLTDKELAARLAGLLQSTSDDDADPSVIGSPSRSSSSSSFSSSSSDER